MKTRIKREGFVCCLSCGYTGKKFILCDDKEIMHPMSLCPKCSNTAYTGNIQGLFQFMSAVTKEIVSIKSSIFDLEAASDTEER